ncbi:MAG: hypothetical protein WCA12_15370 [Burkholderiales bacterium]
MNTSHGYVEDAKPFLTRTPKLQLDDNDQKRIAALECSSRGLDPKCQIRCRLAATLAVPLPSGTRGS